MKVNDPNALGLGQGIGQGTGGMSSAGVSKAGTAARTALGGDTGDGVQLSDLVRNLRTLAAESPERDAHVESIARLYARGAYQVDAEATARGIIDDARKHT